MYRHPCQHPYKFFIRVLAFFGTNIRSFVHVLPIYVVSYMCYQIYVISYMCYLIHDVKVQPTNATDECIGSTVLRDVLTLFQNAGGFDIFTLSWGLPSTYLLI
jgi:hypothetical protein